MNNHLDTCEVLLRAGISKDARTKVDRTPLHFAVYEGHEAIVELLLKYKCDVNARDMVRTAVTKCISVKVNVKFIVKYKYFAVENDFIALGHRETVSKIGEIIIETRCRSNGNVQI